MPATLAVLALAATGCEEGLPDPVTTARPSSPAAAADAARFAPMVWLANGDGHGPMDATTFVARSQLWFDHGDQCDDDKEPVAAEVDPARLARGEYRHRAFPQPVDTERLTCVHEEGTEYGTADDVPTVRSSLGFYLDLDDDARRGDGPGAPTYWERHEDGSGLVAYVYWLFYGYNDYLNKHEGDWERIAVQVRGDEPVAVTFWKHEEPTCVVPWADLGLVEGHPVVFSALGAHGSYPSKGNFGHRGGIDTTSAGTPWRTWSDARPVDGQPWWGYRGRWGEPGPKNFRGPHGPFPGRTQEGVFTERQCGQAAPLPEGFAGDWESREPVRQIPAALAGDYHMRVTLRENGTHEVAYRTDWDTATPKLDCTGTWTLTNATVQVLTLTELITDNDAGNCTVQGTIVLTRTRDDLQFQYLVDGYIGDALLVRRPG
ncbi:hypothetical protein [Actinokineospora sp.]|uniref:hypothetical protein n=1 Tax=Actinokineospora sp. TaxID=1872133 RepID=UPI004037E6AB